jgi:hypothetical protein
MDLNQKEIKEHRHLLSVIEIPLLHSTSKNAYDLYRNSYNSLKQ